MKYQVTFSHEGSKISAQEAFASLSLAAWKIQATLQPYRPGGRSFGKLLKRMQKLR